MAHANLHSPSPEEAPAHRSVRQGGELPVQDDPVGLEQDLPVVPADDGGLPARHLRRRVEHLAGRRRVVEVSGGVNRSGKDSVLLTTWSVTPGPRTPALGHVQSG